MLRELGFEVCRMAQARARALAPAWRRRMKTARARTSRGTGTLWPATGPGTFPPTCGTYNPCGGAQGISRIPRFGQGRASAISRQGHAQLGGRWLAACMRCALSGMGAPQSRASSHPHDHAHQARPSALQTGPPRGCLMMGSGARR